MASGGMGRKSFLGRDICLRIDEGDSSVSDIRRHVYSILSFELEQLPSEDLYPMPWRNSSAYPTEAEHLRAEAPDWALLDDARRIERTFRLRNFREALNLVQKVGELAEAEGHHPDISFGWG